MKGSIESMVKVFGRAALHRFRVLTAIALLIAGSGPAAAADSAPSDEWQYSLEAYVWGPAIDLETTSGDDIHLSLDDIIKDLEMLIFGAGGARKGKWSLFGDLIYMDLKQDDSSTATIIRRTIKTEVEVEMKAWIATLGGGYTVVKTDKFMLDVFAGARYLDLEVDLEFDLGRFKETASDDLTHWDGIIGVRGDTDLSKKWSLHYYLDVGGGDTHSTWQALAGARYRYKNKRDFIFGYRHLEWDFDTSDQGGEVIDDLEVAGPYGGVKFSF